MASDNAQLNQVVRPPYQPKPWAQTNGVSSPGAVKQRVQALSEYGHRVIPVVGKKPAVRGWTGHGPVPSWERQTWPFERADRVGWVPSENFVVLDLDVEPWASVDDLVREIETLYNTRLPLAHIQWTRRGLHALFRTDEPLRNGTLRLPSEADGRVDVRSAGLGLVVLYDDAWALACDAAPALPPELTAALRAPKRPLDRSGVDTAVELPGTALRAVPRAGSGFSGREGQRNRELNDVVFKAVMEFEFDDTDRTRMIAVALAAGLPADEVEKTVRSAVDGALRSSARSRAWLRRVSQLLVGQYSAVEGPFRIARRLAYHSQWMGGRTWVPMSYREMSEFLAVSVSTAHQYVVRLQKLQLIADAVSDRSERTRFALTYPGGALVHDVPNSNNQPLPPIPL